MTRQDAVPDIDSILHSRNLLGHMPQWSCDQHIYSLFVTATYLSDAGRVDTNVAPCAGSNCVTCHKGTHFSPIVRESDKKERWDTSRRDRIRSGEGDSLPAKAG